MSGFHPTCPLPPVCQSWWVCVVLVRSRGWYLFSHSFPPPHLIHINFDEQGEGWNETRNAFLKWYLISQTPDLWKWHLSELQSWLEMTPFGKGVGRGGGFYNEILTRSRTWIGVGVSSATEPLPLLRWGTGDRTESKDGWEVCAGQG